MVPYWSLSDSKSSQVSRTLLSILVDLTNAIVWMASTCPRISKSSSPSINPLGIVPRAPTITGITVFFMFHSFFRLSSKVQVLTFLIAFFQFYIVVCLGHKVHLSTSSFFFFFTITRSGRLTEVS